MQPELTRHYKVEINAKPHGDKMSADLNCFSDFSNETCCTVLNMSAHMFNKLTSYFICFIVSSSHGADGYILISNLHSEHNVSEFLWTEPSLWTNISVRFL